MSGKHTLTLTLSTYICGIDEILEKMDRVLGLKENRQLISYDTAFQLGDFYMSSLILRHMLFKQ